MSQLFEGSDSFRLLTSFSAFLKISKLNIILLGELCDFSSKINLLTFRIFPSNVPIITPPTSTLGLWEKYSLHSAIHLSNTFFSAINIKLLLSTTMSSTTMSSILELFPNNLPKPFLNFFLIGDILDIIHRFHISQVVHLKRSQVD